MCPKLHLDPETFFSNFPLAPAISHNSSLLAALFKILGDFLDFSPSLTLYVQSLAVVSDFNTDPKYDQLSPSTSLSISHLFSGLLQ